MPADISKKDGRVEAFTALTSAWWDGHREYVADEYLTSEQVWGERGLLNFEYELRRVADAETGEMLGDCRHRVRKDTGVTFAVDHRDLLRFRGDKRTNRFRSRMTNDGARLKRRTFDLAVDMAS